ncbi:MAG: proliferating cell nuclear antigen (pcna) [Pelagibacterales bacterium]|uniref:Proliferating cell nuclear antigen PCNA N-terminal domain-containing protein n=1 Tax=viral metagenome TaxID=1070528 RepID=A0A6C0C2F0_9ZZZZ|nr:proliferating cell nuclear antigen (pcna) [Pelagibacterales bacterium]
MKFIIEKKEKVKQFATIFRHAKSLCENVNLYLNDIGLYIQGMTSCHTSLFELKLSNDWFAEYICERDKIIGVNCELLFKCIDCLQEGQKIIISQVKDRLCLQFTGGKNNIDKNFEMPLITLEEERLEVPAADYDTDITIDSHKFTELINELSIFGEDIRMNCVNNQDDSVFTLTGSGISTGSMIVNIKEEDMIEWCCLDNLNLNLLFSVEYLKNICQFSKINRCLILSISENLPLRISYSLSSWMDKATKGEKEEIDTTMDESNNITFFVAPKIED